MSNIGRYIVTRNSLGLNIKLIEPGGAARNVTLFYKSFTSPETNFVTARLSVGAPPAGESLPSLKWDKAIKRLACKLADLLYTELYGDEDAQGDNDIIAAVRGAA